jgi:ABC-type Fe3+-hydroxamate transport system substrate-binding protein
MTRHRAPFLAALALAATASQATFAQDDARATPLFNAEHTVAAILDEAKVKKKALAIVLSNGSTYTGRVKAVGAHAVILTGLSGKEFFDAYVPLGSIVAMEERVRLR